MKITLNSSDGHRLLRELADGEFSMSMVPNGDTATLTCTVWVDGSDTVHDVRLYPDGTYKVTTEINP